MPYTVEILCRAEKTLRALTDRKLYLRLRNTIDALAVEPRPHGCSKLSGGKDIYLSAIAAKSTALFRQGRVCQPRLGEP
jgi:hypothetical protein